MVYKIHVNDRIRVPKKAIPFKDIKERYDVELFDDTKCSRCENLEDRSPRNELCQGCKAFGGSYRFFSSQELKEKNVYSLPQGDEIAIRKALDNLDVDYEWIDHRPIHKMKHDIKFTGKLYTEGDLDDWGNPRPNQREALKKWWKKKVGVIQAPARSGKTAIATAGYCYLKVKTVIIASKKELLNQFYETACGVPIPKYVRGKFVPSPHKAGRQRMTNIPDLQKETGKQIIFKPASYAQLIHFIKKHKEIPDILLITQQSFAKDLDRVRKILNKYYSFPIIDEQHGAGANRYFKFIASLNMKYRMGLSATPDRKDMRSDLTRLVYGGVTSRIRTTTLKPEIRLFHSGITPKVTYQSWTGAFKWLCNSQPLVKEIVKECFADLRAGHNTIIIPVDYKSHLNRIVKMINNQARINREKRDEDWPIVLAKPYTADIKDSLKTLVWADTDDKSIVNKKLPTRSPRVLVAIRSMIKEGVDLKRPSMIYTILPMSAKKGVGAPAFQQMSMRVATPFMGKPAPVCKIWLYNVKMFSSCVSGLIFNEIYERSTLKKNNKNPQYTLSEAEYTAFKTKTAFIQANMTNRPKKSRTNGFW